MRRDEEKPGLERRQFLKTTGLASTGAAAVIAGTVQSVARETLPQQQVQQRHRDTEPVKRFHTLNRL